MSNPQSSPEPQRRPAGGYSPDCVDVFYDGPANANDQPFPPALLELGRAVREKLIRHGEIQAPSRSDAARHEEERPSAPNGVAASQAVGDAETANGVLRVPLDASLILRLHGLECPIDLIDESGKVVARVIPLAPAERQ